MSKVDALRFLVQHYYSAAELAQASTEGEPYLIHAANESHRGKAGKGIVSYDTRRGEVWVWGPDCEWPRKAPDVKVKVRALARACLAKTELQPRLLEAM